MKDLFKNILFRLILVVMISFSWVNQFTANAQPENQDNKSARFQHATITSNKTIDAPKEIVMKEGDYISRSDFFNQFFNAFHFTNDNEARPINSFTDPLGVTHTRYKQYYKNLEIADVQYILHDRGGMVYLAHGNFVRGIELDVNPSISGEQAINAALKELNLTNDQGATIIKKQGNVTCSSQLMIACYNQIYSAENLLLVYRCAVFSKIPFVNYYVDIDANNGKLVKKISRMYEDNIDTEGLSPYYGVVDITISDEDYPEWNDTSYWHLSDWQSYGGTGDNWWIADTTLGNYGGYDNRWYEVLETDPILLTGNNPVLNFYHRYRVESPEVYQDYDGWDGMNVRISTNGGATWQVMQNPSPQYTCNSLYSFGNIHEEGEGIPGWAGIQNDWVPVTFDLTAYQGDNIMLRFAFASDGALSTADGNNNLFGWQLDNIIVSSSSGILFSNNGVSSGLTPLNLFHDVSIIPGKYRLRETKHGKGIATYNGLAGSSLSESVDYVEGDSIIDNLTNQPGVAVHWILEKTYEYYQDKFGRLSYDQNNSRLIAYSQWMFTFSDGYVTPNNAMWSGDMIFIGAGDGLAYGSWGTIDIVGHELTHGVTQYSAGLLYENESGALNESFSDIFGTSIEMYVKGPANANWVMGEDHVLLMGNIIRSMENPGLYNDPDTYHGTYWIENASVPTEENDYGGVHTNCGVQNYWYYLLCKGGQGINDQHDPYSVTGIGIENAEQIAYRTLTSYLQPSSNYFDAAHYSIQSAIDLFGENSQQHSSVIDAWNAVGIRLGANIQTTQWVLIEAETGETKQANIGIQNIGYDTLIVDSIQFSNDSYALQNTTSLPITLLSNELMIIDFQLVASTAGNYTDTMYVYSNDSLHTPKKIPLVAVITSPPFIKDNLRVNKQTLKVKPNPSCDGTTFEFSLSQPSFVTINIYNLQGEKITTISSMEYPEGLVIETWDGSNEQGIRVKPGVYCCTVQTEDFLLNCKIILE